MAMQFFLSHNTSAWEFQKAGVNIFAYFFCVLPAPFYSQLWSFHDVAMVLIYVWSSLWKGNSQSYPIVSAILLCNGKKSSPVIVFEQIFAEIVLFVYGI